MINPFLRISGGKITGNYMLNAPNTIVSKKKVPINGGALKLYKNIIYIKLYNHTQIALIMFFLCKNCLI